MCFEITDQENSKKIFYQSRLCGGSKKQKIGKVYAFFAYQRLDKLQNHLPKELLREWNEETSISACIILIAHISLSAFPYVRLSVFG